MAQQQIARAQVGNQDQQFFCAFFRDMKCADDAATRQWWLDVWSLHIRIYRSNIHIWITCIALDLLTLASPRHCLDTPFLLLSLYVGALSIWQLINNWRRINTLKKACRA
jgi:hypothetical protein